MAVYNGEKYLREAIDSILRQTFTDFEFIIVDDASTDGTTEILARYAGHDNRINVLTNRENLGLPKSLNRGLKHCRAPLVARADADDICDKTRLAKQAAFMDAHQEVGILSCQRWWMEADGTIKNSSHAPLNDADIRFHLLFSNCILHPGVMSRADVVSKAGGYDESKWTAQDYDLWARLKDKTRFAILDEPLVYYRLHNASIGTTRGDAGDEISNSVSRRLLSDYLQREITEDEHACLKTMYHGMGRIEADRMDSTLDIIREFLDRVQECENRKRYADTRHRLAKNLLGQSIGRLQEDHKASVRFYREAMRLAPREVLNVRGLKQAVRLGIASKKRKARNKGSRKDAENAEA